MSVRCARTSNEQIFADTTHDGLQATPLLAGRVDCGTASLMTWLEKPSVVMTGTTTPTVYVVKRFKTRLGCEEVPQHTREKYEGQMEIQMISRELAKEFNKLLEVI